MHPDAKLCPQLQDLDLQIDELSKQISELPKHIAQIEKTLENRIRRLESEKAALAVNQKDRKRFEGDIQVSEQKISKLRSQLMEAKTNEQYRAFQAEIAFCEGEIRKSEDKILELMGQSEPLEKNVKLAEGELAGDKQRVAEEVQQARARTEALKKQLADVRARRGDVAGQMQRPTLTQYERMRPRKAGRAVAEIVNERCSGCHIMVRPQIIQDLRITERLITCESCGRFLYIEAPPTTFEEIMAADPRGTRVDMS
jgi:uncharacterized protein